MAESDRHIGKEKLKRRDLPDSTEIVFDYCRAGLFFRIPHKNQQIKNAEGGT